MNDYMILHKTCTSQLHARKRPIRVLAKSLGVSEPTLRNWRNGKLPLQHADPLLQALDLGGLILRQPPDRTLPILTALRVARDNLGLNVAHMARVLNVAHTTFYNWEQGKGRGPAMWLLERWAVYLGLGGITTQFVPQDYFIELPVDPKPHDVERMTATHHYQAHRYVPYSVNYARLRLQAFSLGMDDPQFDTDRTFNDQPLILAKFRPAWTLLAVQHKSVERGLDALIDHLHRRANTK